MHYQAIEVEAEPAEKQADRVEAKRRTLLAAFKLHERNCFTSNDLLEQCWPSEEFSMLIIGIGNDLVEANLRLERKPFRFSLRALPRLSIQPSNVHHL